MELQQYDRELVLRLSTRFAEYDYSHTGSVAVGVDVPSAEQIKEMQDQIEGEDKFTALMPMWEEMRKKIQQDLLKKKELDRLLKLKNMANIPKTKQEEEHEEKEDEKVRVARNSFEFRDEDHENVKLRELDFSWSKKLWKKAASDTGRIALVLLVIYLIMGWYVFIYDSNQMNAIQGWYFIAATLSTVGFGDFAPESQMQRFLAIFMIPFGLIVLGFVISYARARAKSKPNKAKRAEDGSIKRIFETLSIPHDGYLTREVFLKSAHLVHMSLKKAESFFDKVDKGDGKMYLPKHFHPFETVPGRIFLIMVKIYGTIIVGGIVFKMWPSEDNRDLSWIDAFYFSCVTATSIG
jgi:hypothetical protein